MLSRSPGCCNSQPVLPVFQSMASRICKEVTGQDDLQLRSPVQIKRCRSHIHGETLSRSSLEVSIG